VLYVRPWQAGVGSDDDVLAPPAVSGVQSDDAEPLVARAGSTELE
jgi:hypothetical protein